MPEDRKSRNIKKQLRDICKTGKLDSKRIILFGCVPDGKIIRDELENYGYSLNAIIDNNKSKAGQECLGVLIYTPEVYLEVFQDDFIFLICSNYWREMSKQLENMGYNRNIHIVVLHGTTPKLENDSITEFFKSTICVLKGYHLYRKFSKKYRYSQLFICPYPGTGDIYMAGGYFQEYIKREKIEEYFVLVMNKACAKVATLFGMKNIEIISEKDKEYLMYMYNFLGPDQIPMKPLLYWGWRSKRHVIQRYCESINFDDMFKYDVYGLERECSRCQPEFMCNKQYTDDFFEKHKLIKGKTVVMAPYAGSFVSDIPGTFWIKLAEILKNRGYTVCTNSSGSDEPVIEGTERVFFDLTQTVPILDTAGYFIGLRSGLCDISSSSKCRKIILYENGFNASQYDFFSLKLMGLSDDAIEIIYKCESDDEFLEIVLKHFEEN